MKIYRVSTYAKPPGGKFQDYAQLSCRKSDEKFLREEHFHGKAFPGKWRPITLFFEEPLWPRADFYTFYPENFVCTERAKTLAGPALEKAGEFLPVTIEGESEVHYIYNVTACGAFIDPPRSIYEYELDEPAETARGVRVAPAFQTKPIAKLSVFKLSEESGRTIYSVERTGNPSNGEFKALVEHHRLTGIKFDLAWSEKSGPVPWRCPPAKDGDFVWKYGDGKKFRPR